MLTEIGEGLYVAEGAVRFFGFMLGTRMAVVRLERDALLLYSPLSTTPGLRGELEKLGQVRYVVAPNKIHNQTLADYAAAYPGAELWVAPGLPERRPDLSPHRCREARARARPRLALRSHLPLSRRARDGGRGARFRVGLRRAARRGAAAWSRRALGAVAAGRASVEPTA